MIWKSYFFKIISMLKWENSELNIYDFMNIIMNYVENGNYVENDTIYIL